MAEATEEKNTRLEVGNRGRASKPEELGQPLAAFSLGAATPNTWRGVCLGARSSSRTPPAWRSPRRGGHDRRLHAMLSHSEDEDTSQREEITAPTPKQLEESPRGRRPERPRGRTKDASSSDSHEHTREPRAPVPPVTVKGSARMASLGARRAANANEEPEARGANAADKPSGKTPALRVENEKEAADALKCRRAAPWPVERSKNASARIRQSESAERRRRSCAGEKRIPEPSDGKLEEARGVAAAGWSSSDAAKAASSC
jgi:hypothetical protein